MWDIWRRCDMSMYSKISYGFDQLLNYKTEFNLPDFNYE